MLIVAFFMLRSSLKCVKPMSSVAGLAMPICQISLLDVVASESFLLGNSMHIGALPLTCNINYYATVIVIKQYLLQDRSVLQGVRG